MVDDTLAIDQPSAPVAATRRGRVRDRLRRYGWLVKPNGTRPPAVVAWHAVADSRDPTRLADLLAEEVVFCSPAVYTPQEGKELTTGYLAAAMVVLGPTLRYVEEWYSDRSAVLEFEAELAGTFVQGIDMLRWNDEDRLVEFTVMVRPFRGLEKLIELMGRQLAQQAR
jgi:hypothetical protein